MTLMEAALAYLAADEMSRQELPYGLALALCMVKKETAAQAGFLMEQEGKLVREYAQTDEDGNIRLTSEGTFIPKNQKGLEEYNRRRKELGETEARVEPKKMKVTPPETIKPCHLMALEPFIEFEA